MMLLARIQAYTGPRPDVQRLVPAEAMRILDLGCSTGALGAVLRSAKRGRVVEGVEADAGFALEAATKLDRVVHADLNDRRWVEHLSNEEAFDCVIAADVLEHLIDPWVTLRDAVRLLRPGGSTVVSVPNIRHLSAFLTIVVRGRFPRRERGIFDRSHLRWFTLEEARHLCVSAGLSVTSVRSNLRLLDQPGGRVNQAIGRLPSWIADISLFRETLSYQFLLLAEKTDAIES